MVEGAGTQIIRKPTKSVEKSATAFRTISEVAAELNLPTHVLRFWETKFVQIKPMKRGGGRRYYRPEDILILRQIRELLYDDGYTIKGVQKLIREVGLKKVEAPRVKSKKLRGLAKHSNNDTGPSDPNKMNMGYRLELQKILKDLVALREGLNKR
ncbi:MAG: MerR family transcriptional regulator [Pseudomonadota bacterium]|nr:MerR family transcriptional regulator [Pseudomonadota bacterium]